MWELIYFIIFFIVFFGVSWIVLRAIEVEKIFKPNKVLQIRLFYIIVCTIVAFILARLMIYLFSFTTLI
ncbi:MAG: DUF1146 family protein [Acholeplasmatales bacterium]|nr:DUF1146 family protein [Acholeplasmatales bacterium]